MSKQWGHGYHAGFDAGKAASGGNDIASAVVAGIAIGAAAVGGVVALVNWITEDEKPAPKKSLFDQVNDAENRRRINEITNRRAS